MNKYVSISIVALACFAAEASVVAAADGPNQVSIARSMAPSDEQELASLKGDERDMYSGFCISYRDNVIAKLNNLDKKLTKKVAMQIFGDYSKRLKIAFKYAGRYDDRLEICRQITSYKQELDSLFKQLVEYGDERITRNNNLNDVKCYTVSMIVGLTDLCAKSKLDPSKVLALAPTDEQEIANLNGENRELYSKFCISFRDNIIASIKGEDGRWANRLARQVFTNNQSNMQRFSSFMSFQTHAPWMCDRFPIYEQKLIQAYEQLRKYHSKFTLSDTWKNHQLKDIQCLTVKKIVKLSQECKVLDFDQDDKEIFE